MRARLVEDQSDMAIKAGRKAAKGADQPRLSTNSTIVDDEDGENSGDVDAGEEIDDEEVPF